MFVDEVKYFSLKYAWKKALSNIFVTRVYLTVCSYHVMYAFQSESTLYSCLYFSRVYFWRYISLSKSDLFFPVFVFHRCITIGILKYIQYFQNEGLHISWISRYNSILGLKNGFHNTLFYSVSSWTQHYFSNMRWIDTRSRRQS